MTTEIKTRKVKTGNYETFIMEGGEQAAEKVIYLHGSGPGVSGKSNLQKVFPSYFDDFHVIAPDFIGFGYTDHPEDPPKNGTEWVRARIDQIIHLMDEMNIDKAHLVGNSLGGV